jgi:hypothetical protein
MGKRTAPRTTNRALRERCNAVVIGRLDRPKIANKIFLEICAEVNRRKRDFGKTIFKRVSSQCLTKKHLAPLRCCACSRPERCRMHTNQFDVETACLITKKKFPTEKFVSKNSRRDCAATNILPRSHSFPFVTVPLPFFAKFEWRLTSTRRDFGRGKLRKSRSVA